MAVNRLAVLGIAVDPTKAVAGARRANAAIRGVGQTAANVKNRIFSLQGALVALGGGLVIRSFLNTASSLEKLKVQLKTVTGSANNADKAFDRLVEFTTRTPYEINEVVTAFTKLKAFGLDPTEEAMTSFGNTASAMGKDLDQMIEAVADAATGEFERLKEFGIKSSKQGDLVKFTFQGMTTEVKNSSEAIQGYIMGIGNNQFGGAMADQMDTMDGALSNFRGSWTLFQDELMNNGPFQLAKGLLNELSNSLFGDEKSVASNAKAAGQAITMFVRNAALGTASFIDSISGMLDIVSNQISGMWDTFRSLPAFVQQVGIVGAFLGGPKVRLAILAMIGGLTTIKRLLGGKDQDLDGLTSQIKDMEFLVRSLQRMSNDPLIKIDPQQLAKTKAQLNLLRATRDLVLANQGLSGTGPEAVTSAKQQLAPAPELQALSFGGSSDSAVKAVEQLFARIDQVAISKENERIARETANEFSMAGTRVESFSGSMGEISALHSKAQQEMSHVTAVFEERNADLHAAAMARKTESFNVFKGHFNEGWAEMEEKALPVLESLADKMLSIFGVGGTFAKGIGDATADMILFGKSGTDAMKALGRTIIHEVISAMVAMGVQSAINWAKDKFFAASNVATAYMSGTAIAAAYAPAAAAVSLATFGANAIPASTGIASTFALAKGLSLTGALERGGPAQRSGTYLVGERGPELFTPNQSGQVTSNKNMGTGNTANVTFNINAIDTQSATGLIMAQRGTIIGVINQALNERGRAALV
tara:strand:+ start:11032 stop:13317 length:2286 start_codon:yes stop_codon:yes gene_type:complete